jgi:hypothetical protein
MPVWVDLAALTQHRERGKPYGDTRPGGVFLAGLVRGVMWAQVMSDRGLWLGVVTCELERHGAPVMTAPGARAALGPAASAPGQLPPDVRKDEQPTHRGRAAQIRARALTTSPRKK